MVVRCTIHAASQVLDRREEVVALYIPIGGGAEGRGGSSSGKKGVCRMIVKSVATLERTDGWG